MTSTQTQTEQQEDDDVNNAIVHHLVDELQFQIDDIEHQIVQILTHRCKSCKTPTQPEPTMQDLARL